MDPDFSSNRSKKRENIDKGGGELAMKQKHSFIQKKINQERGQIVDGTLNRLRTFVKSLPFPAEVTKGSHELILTTSTNRKGDSQLTIEVGAVSEVEIQQVSTLGSSKFIF